MQTIPQINRLEITNGIIKLTSVNIILNNTALQKKNMNFFKIIYIKNYSSQIVLIKKFVFWERKTMIVWFCLEYI